MATGDKQLDISGGMPYGGGYGGFTGGGFGVGLLFGILFGGFRGHGGAFGGGCCDGANLGAFEKLESIEQQIQTQSVTEQFNATNVNINNGFRDTALGFASVNKGICDLGSKIDMNTLLLEKSITNGNQLILDKLCANETQALRDQLANAQLNNALNSRGFFEGSGPVITAHEPAHARNNDVAIMAMLAGQHAANVALNTGTNVNTGFQGQGLGQGIGQAGLQK